MGRLSTTLSRFPRHIYILEIQVLKLLCKSTEVSILKVQCYESGIFYTIKYNVRFMVLILFPSFIMV